MKNKNSNLFVIFSVFCLAVAFAFSPALAQKEPYKIGVILTAGGRYAALGGPQKDGAFLAAEEINRRGGVNGHMLELIFEDDGGDPAVASRLAKKIIAEDKVSAIVGGTPIAAAHTIALIGEEKEVPSILLVPQSSVVEGKKYAFHNAQRVELSSLADTKHISETLKWKRVAILHDTTEYGIFMSKGGEKALKEKGVEVLKEQFLSTDTDLTSLLIKVNAWKPEGIYLIASIPSAPAILMRNLRDLKMKIPVTASNALMTGKFLELVGRAGEGMYLQSGIKYGDQSSEQKYFFEAMASKYSGVLPMAMHGSGWDGIRLFAHVMKKVGNDPKKMKGALETLRGYQGARGEYNFSPSDHNGLALDTISMVQVRGGKYVHLYSFKQ